ncbi:unnamed protein product [Notodromas monacha]|uniref:Transmembrane protein 179 n=1 Tax=Notodromas monacha TaxID=399045 RepID=A0A7R9BCL0_9CRUS|nr:unnamed protein product [Notodromas monacha]CAG0912298.1 unnamed protein product [Notodromas monacha]
MKGLVNVVLLSQLAAYFAGFVLSLCLFVPMTLHLYDFRGFCLLFSTGTWREEDGQFVVDWASQLYCDYCIAVGGLLAILCLVQMYRLITFLYRGLDSSFLSAFCDVVISVGMAVLVLASAVMITTGFKSWCDDIMGRFPSCNDAAVNPIDKADGIQTSGFYVQLGTAQFGAWGSWAACVGMSVFALLKVWQYHKSENIKLTMAQNRRRFRKGNVEDAADMDLIRG